MSETKITTAMYKVNARKAVNKRIDNKLKKLRPKKKEQLRSLLDDYAAALTALNEYDKQTIIAQEIKCTTLKSYCDNGDKNWLSPTVILHYIRKRGMPLDVQAMDITEQYGVPITEQDLIDFINENQAGRGSFYKFQEVETVKEAIKEITGFNATPEFIKYLKVNYFQKFKLKVQEKSDAPF